MLFRKGLNLELQSKLACCDEGIILDQYINLAIRIDNLIRSRRPTRSLVCHTTSSPNTNDPEPMQTGLTRITSEETEQPTHSPKPLSVL